MPILYHASSAHLKNKLLTSVVNRMLLHTIWYNGLVGESKRKPNTPCIVCGTLIYRRPGTLKQSNGAAYCSQSCYGKSCRKEKPCVICGQLILAGANKRTCSRVCANKSRTGITYSGRRTKDNVVTQRRLKVRLINERGTNCERCDFELTDILQIHHRDRNRKHNMLTNLELLCPNCHAREHYLKN